MSKRKVDDHIEPLSKITKNSPLNNNKECIASILSFLPLVPVMRCSRISKTWCDLCDKACTEIQKKYDIIDYLDCVCVCNQIKDTKDCRTTYYIPDITPCGIFPQFVSFESKCYNCGCDNFWDRLKYPYFKDSATAWDTLILAYMNIFNDTESKNYHLTNIQKFIKTTNIRKDNHVAVKYLSNKYMDVLKHGELKEFQQILYSIIDNSSQLAQECNKFMNFIEKCLPRKTEIKITKNNFIEWLKRKHIHFFLPIN
jgi:hypothetical protein